MVGRDTSPANTSRSGSPLKMGVPAMTVERVNRGEVSLYLTEQLRQGDQLELRGPISGAFAWRSGEGGDGCCRSPAALDSFH